MRWALEELQLPYDVRLVSFGTMKEPSHLALHPFGQIPTLEDGELVLFETGAIVLHLAQQHPGLFPEDPNARARAVAWMFAAVNTVEPPILELATATLLESKEQLSARLGTEEWLDGEFSAGDLMMVSVLLRFRSSGILDQFANLAAYVERGEARPAYERAFAAQLAVNRPSAHGS